MVVVFSRSRRGKVVVNNHEVADLPKRKDW